MSASRADQPSFRSQVRSAVIWRSGSQIVAQLIAWASTFFVLRILDPSDYGLYSMAATVLVLLTILNGYGLANALVQRKEVSHHELRQLFGMLVVVNVSLALIQIFAAPYAARYYGEPAIANILRVLALVYLTNPFLAVGYAVLAREMDFRRQAQVNMIAAVIGAFTALAGALAGLGYWTLVIAPLVGFSIRAIGMALAARIFFWPSFDFRGARAMAGFGGAVTLSSLFYFIQTQSDVIIAGRAFDSYTVGLYTTALFLAQIFTSKVVPPLNEVAFSAYARIQDDREGFARGFLTSVRVIMFLAIPFCIGLAVTAEPLVHSLLGAKWLPMVPILVVLGLAMPWMALHVLFAPASNAAGYPGIGVRNSIAGALIMPIAFLIGVQWGVIGLALSWLLAYPLVTLYAAYNSRRAIGYGLLQLGAALVPLITAALAMAISVYVADQHMQLESDLLRLAVLVALGGAVYIGWIAIFSRERILEVIDLIRNR